jgi:nucleoid DNA-binding protein
MHHDETIAAVARRLYRFSRRDVAEVLEVLVEVWQEALLQSDTAIHIKGLGKLRVDEQEIATPQSVKELLAAQYKEVPMTIKRYYFRFSPSNAFKQRLVEFRKVREEDDHE